MEWDKDKIRAFRKRLSLTQYQFAELLGTSRVLISNWETGKQSPCGMSQKFLTLLAVKDIKRDIEEIKSKEQEFGEISGEKILAFREKLSLSQTEFAERLGRNHSTVSYWERGEKSPGKKSQSWIRKLAKEEGIKLQELGKETESSLTSNCDTNTSSTSNRGGANFTSSPSARSGRLTHDFLPEPNIRIVGSGIDKLYLGFYVEVNEKLLNTLEAAKAEASNSSFGEALISIGENTFTIEQHSKDRYRYILSNGDMGLQVAKGNADSYPNVYVDMKSLYILETSVDKAVNEVRSFVSSNFGEILREKVSQVEMYVDVAGEKVYQGDVDKFVSRAVNLRFYQEYGEFTGFGLGKGDIQAKVYNKKAEIKKSKKEYMYSIWDGVSRDKDEEVWRIEFSLSRRALKGWDVEDYDSFKALSGDIWRYLTEEWLSMREQDNENTTRRTLTFLWEEVQKARLSFGKVTGALRNNKRISSIEQYISQMGGLQTSMGAVLYKLGHDVGKQKQRVRKLAAARIDEQSALRRILAKGLAVDDLTSEEIEIFSSIEFEQEVLRKAVNCS